MNDGEERRDVALYLDKVHRVLIKSPHSLEELKCLCTENILASFLLYAAEKKKIALNFKAGFETVSNALREFLTKTLEVLYSVEMLTQKIKYSEIQSLMLSGKLNLSNFLEIFAADAELSFGSVVNVFSKFHCKAIYFWLYYSYAPEYVIKLLDHVLSESSTRVKLTEKCIKMLAREFARLCLLLLNERVVSVEYEKYIIGDPKYPSDFFEFAHTQGTECRVSFPVFKSNNTFDSVFAYGLTLFVSVSLTRIRSDTQDDRTSRINLFTMKTKNGSAGISFYLSVSYENSNPEVFLTIQTKSSSGTGSYSNKKKAWHTKTVSLTGFLDVSGTNDTQFSTLQIVFKRGTSHGLMSVINKSLKTLNARGRDESIDPNFRIYVDGSPVHNKGSNVFFLKFPSIHERIVESFISARLSKDLSLRVSGFNLCSEPLNVLPIFSTLCVNELQEKINLNTKSISKTNEERKFHIEDKYFLGDNKILSTKDWEVITTQDVGKLLKCMHAWHGIKAPTHDITSQKVIKMYNTRVQCLVYNLCFYLDGLINNAHLPCYEILTTVKEESKPVSGTKGIYRDKLVATYPHLKNDGLFANSRIACYNTHVSVSSVLAKKQLALLEFIDLENLFILVSKGLDTKFCRNTLMQIHVPNPVLSFVKLTEHTSKVSLHSPLSTAVNSKNQALLLSFIGKGLSFHKKSIYFLRQFEQLGGFQFLRFLVENFSTVGLEVLSALYKLGLDLEDKDANFHAIAEQPQGFQIVSSCLKELVFNPGFLCRVSATEMTSAFQYWVELCTKLMSQNPTLTRLVIGTQRFLDMFYALSKQVIPRIIQQSGQHNLKYSLKKLANSLFSLVSSSQLSQIYGVGLTNTGKVNQRYNLTKSGFSAGEILQLIVFLAMNRDNDFAVPLLSAWLNTSVDQQCHKYELLEKVGGVELLLGLGSRSAETRETSSHQPETEFGIKNSQWFGLLVLRSNHPRYVKRRDLFFKLLSSKILYDINHELNTQSETSETRSLFGQIHVGIILRCLFPAKSRRRNPSLKREGTVSTDLAETIFDLIFPGPHSPFSEVRPIFAPLLFQMLDATLSSVLNDTKNEAKLQLSRLVFENFLVILTVFHEAETQRYQDFLNSSNIVSFFLSWSDSLLRLEEPSLNSIFSYLMKVFSFILTLLFCNVPDLHSKTNTSLSADSARLEAYYPRSSRNQISGAFFIVYLNQICNGTVNMEENNVGWKICTNLLSRLLINVLNKFMSMEKTDLFVTSFSYVPNFAKLSDVLTYKVVIPISGFAMEGFVPADSELLNWNADENSGTSLEQIGDNKLFTGSENKLLIKICLQSLHNSERDRLVGLKLSIVWTKNRVPDCICIYYKDQYDRKVHLAEQSELGLSAENKTVFIWFKERLKYLVGEFCSSKDLTAIYVEFSFPKRQKTLLTALRDSDTRKVSILLSKFELVWKKPPAVINSNQSYIPNCTTLCVTYLNSLLHMRPLDWLKLDTSVLPEDSAWATRLNSLFLCFLLCINVLTLTDQTIADETISQTSLVYLSNSFYALYSLDSFREKKETLGNQFVKGLLIFFLEKLLDASKARKPSHERVLLDYIIQLKDGAKGAFESDSQTELVLQSFIEMMLLQKDIFDETVNNSRGVEQSFTSFNVAYGINLESEFDVAAKKPVGLPKSTKRALTTMIKRNQERLFLLSFHSSIKRKHYMQHLQKISADIESFVYASNPKFMLRNNGRFNRLEADFSNYSFSRLGLYTIGTSYSHSKLNNVVKRNVNGMQHYGLSFSSFLPTAASSFEENAQTKKWGDLNLDFLSRTPIKGKYTDNSLNLSAGENESSQESLPNIKKFNFKNSSDDETSSLSEEESLDNPGIETEQATIDNFDEVLEHNDLQWSDLSSPRVVRRRKITPLSWVNRAPSAVRREQPTPWPKVGNSNPGYDVEPEYVFMGFRCIKVKPANIVEGRIIVSNHALYFDPDPSAIEKAVFLKQGSNLSDLQQLSHKQVESPQSRKYRKEHESSRVSEIIYNNIKSQFLYGTSKRRFRQCLPLKNFLQVYKRRFEAEERAVEIFVNETHSHIEEYSSSRTVSFFFAFEDEATRKKFLGLINRKDILKENEIKIRLEAVIKAWRERQISNYDYLLELNRLGGRSEKDLCQYPIFPWIISNYESPNLDLQDKSNYRDLSLPVGALNPERFTEFQERYDSLGEDLGEMPKFLYGSHYSTMGGVVLYFLLRQEPFTSLHIKLQQGHFDYPDRLFNSVPEAWKLCTTSLTEVKELVPQFYSDSNFLLNGGRWDLGKTQDGVQCDNVILPPWAHNKPGDQGPYVNFIRIMREALESEFVSNSLHHWVDLIFGFKQRGEAALEAKNLFYYLTYPNVVDFSKIEDEKTKEATKLQISAFGQCPDQLFHAPSNNRGKIFVHTPIIQSYKVRFSPITLLRPGIIPAHVLSLLFTTQTQQIGFSKEFGYLCLMSLGKLCVFYISSRRVRLIKTEVFEGRRVESVYISPYSQNVHIVWVYL
eukprot:maker-scaffold_20-snap-gene-0.44-mRNA-1 protein AED:0.38 eAED:0.38 QI:0/0.5/0.4/0.6/1/1/5/909/2488